MNILILDTETANTVEQPLPYDYGWMIVNNETGEILKERSFVCAEIFLDRELMENAYFAEKISNYWEDIKNGSRIMKRLKNIRKILWHDMKEFNVDTVGAYNMAFDQKASSNNIRYITSSKIKWFFPFGTKFFCIWHMACTSFLNTEDYINFAKEHNFISNFGRVQTSAECAYRYLINNPDFIESHTGLEDVKIEVEIYLNCLKNNNENMKDNIDPNCWQIVQKTKKAMEKK